MIRVILISAIFLINCIPPIFGQGATKKHVHDLNWDNETAFDTLTTNVPKGLKELHLKFDAKITSGKLKLKGYTPLGKTTTYLSIINTTKKGSSKSSNSNSNSNNKSYEHSKTTYYYDQQQSKGTVNKRFSNPTSGVWKFVIQTKNATGSMHVDISYN